MTQHDRARHAARPRESNAVQLRPQLPAERKEDLEHLKDIGPAGPESSPEPTVGD
jgi:hypothetical protein